MNRPSNRMIRIFVFPPVVILACLLILPHRTGLLQEPESPSAIFTVTNNLNAGAGSFRQAVVDANATTALDNINFAVGTGPVEITFTSALPDITQPVIIDGTTQPGFSGTPLITLAGNFSGSVRITGGGSTVKAITLTRFQNGLVLENAGGNIVTGSYIGGCPPPALGCGNSNIGVRINNSPSNRIGGFTLAERNIINGNENKGIEITGSLSTGNIISGNYIGRLADSSAGGNGNFGVAIIGAPNNRVGGTLAGERNVITGNAQLCNLPPLASNSNVFISGAGASGNTVQGNYIGTSVDGMSGADTCGGLRIENAPNNTIGGTVGTTPGGSCTGACNLISGFAQLGNESGVMVTGSGATGNSLLGNYIGTNAAGAVRINNDVGITVTANAANNTIGGTTAAGRNLIANGLWLSGGAATNTVQGNYIGTDTTGTVGIGFLSGGQVSAALTIENAPNNRIGTANGTTLGGACTGGCNLISGNNGEGVQIKGSGSTGNRVDYNYIGLTGSGTTALRNPGGALKLQNGANDNTIGRPSGYSYQSTTPAPATKYLIQDHATGDFFQFNTATREYTVKDCRGYYTVSDIVPLGDVIQNGTTVKFVHAGSAGFLVRLTFDTATGRGFGSIEVAPVSEAITVTDANISNHVGDCPPEGMQTIVGGVTNAANNNTVNFVSVGFDTSGHINISTAQDGNVFNLSGNFNVYSNIFTATNAGTFPALEVGNGNDNVIADLNVTAVDPGPFGSRPIVLGPGANRNIAPPQNLAVVNEMGGVARVVGNFSGMPNTNYRITISGFNRTTISSGATVTQVIPTGTTVLIRTNANGTYNINETYSGPDAFALFSSERVAAVITQINAVQIASEGPAASFVDVSGDTSEFSLSAVVPHPKFDRDDDGKTDFIVYRPGGSNDGFSYWYELRSSDSTFRATQFGNGEDIPVPGDWQGDSVMDLAVWRPSSATWYYSRITGNPTTNYVSIPWGSPADKPIVGDFDGDGANDAAIFRPATGTWWIRRSDGTGFVQRWGVGSDKLVPADYDGDGDTDVAVYRSGTWYISVCPTCPVRYEQFGLASDVPTPADYDGDGRDDVAVFRPSTGIWYMQRSTAGFLAMQFGLPADKPIGGDFDADGKADVGVFRASEGVFYVLRSQQGFVAVRWGLSTDTPVGMFPNS